LERVGRESRLGDPPVCVLTAEREPSLPREVAALLPKPIRMEKLLEIVAAYCCLPPISEIDPEQARTRLYETRRCLARARTQLTPSRSLLDARIRRPQGPLNSVVISAAESARE